MKKEKNPYYDENDMLKVRPFRINLMRTTLKAAKKKMIKSFLIQLIVLLNIH